MRLPGLNGGYKPLVVSYLTSHDGADGHAGSATGSIRWPGHHPVVRFGAVGLARVH